MFNLPTPKNITIWWNFGSLLGLILACQILTGIFLSMHYISGEAFVSLRHIVRDVNRGWLLRSLHANGASFFFLCVYSHIGRGLYYGRYSFTWTWLSGTIILLVLIATAFLGYVLPWGQMSFWGATVITNLLSAFPYGDDLVAWLWGGFSVGLATLTRFYTLHFVIPFVLSAMVFLHVLLLHRTGRNNPLGLNCNSEKIPFHSYHTIKDIVGFLAIWILLLFLVFFYPNVLGEVDNFIEANPMRTPSHIVPEWYFLFAYAILRSIPNKLGGVIGLVSSIFILFIIPLMNKSVKGNTFRPFRKCCFWIFVVSFVCLTFVGSYPVEEPFVSLRQMLTAVYYVCFLLHGRVCIRKF